MGLQGVLAALLLEGAAHGYQLKGTLEDELGPLWVTSASQVYLTLGRMQRDDLVSSRRVRQQALPDRQLLSLTRAGRALAERWLYESDDPDESVLRLAVARIVAPRHFSDVVDIIVEQRSAGLAELRQLRAQDATGFQREAIDAEIQRAQADVRWAASIRDRAAAIVAIPRAPRQAGRVAHHG
ncbi:MAG: PadR family transcriptional regulator [Candidatus Dormibacteria bacterium]